MYTKFKFLPVLALGLCWMVGSDANSQTKFTKDCEEAKAKCYSATQTNGKPANPQACEFYKNIKTKAGPVSQNAYNSCCVGGNGMKPADAPCNTGDCETAAWTCNALQTQ